MQLEPDAMGDVIKRLRKKLAAIDSGIQIESVWGFGFRLNESVNP